MAQAARHCWAIQSCCVEGVIPSKHETHVSSKTLLGFSSTGHSPRKEH